MQKGDLSDTRRLHDRRRLTLLGRDEYRSDDTNDLFSLISQVAELLRGKKLSFRDEAEPISRLSGFFVSDRHLCDEVRSRLTGLSFVNISSHRRGRSQ